VLKDEYQRARAVRVAMVASSLRLAGAEKQTIYTARALLEARIDVRFFNLGPGGYYAAVLRQSGVPMQQIYSANRPLSMLATLTRTLRRLQPEIVLVSQFGDLVYGMPAGRCCGALTLGGIRSDGFQELNARGRLGRWMFRMTDGFVANSYRAKANLVSRGIKAEKIEVLPNVLDLQDFDARSLLPLKASLPSNRIVVAAVGSLHVCKRFDRFIEALALARQSEPALTGVIAGEDRGAKTALLAKAKSLGLTENDLTFLGECDQVPALLSHAALLVLSSDYEGFPNVVLEAMAARLPVITTPAGDAHRVVHHGKNGYVVEMEDIEGLAGRIVQLARLPATRKEFGEAGRKRVDQEYSYDGLAERLMAIFQTFAAQAGRASLRDQLAPTPVLCEPCLA
jgi:glycosyltransferase involved in cell wall biosynthesis